MRKMLVLAVLGALAATALATVPSTSTTAGPYACTGSASPLQSFPFPYRFHESSHLQVTKTQGGVTTPLVLTTDYTVQNSGTVAGGTVTVTAGTKCPAGATLTIKRVVPLTQTTSFRSSTTYTPVPHENGFDKTMMALQQVDGRVTETAQRLDSIVTGTGFVQKTGDTMTGPLVGPSATFDSLTLTSTATSTVASGENGFACTDTGCRFDLGPGASDYLYSDGTYVKTGSAFYSGGSVLLTGTSSVYGQSSASTAVSIRGNSTSSGTGVKLGNNTTLTTGKITSFCADAPVTCAQERASIDATGLVSAAGGFVSNAASGSNALTVETGAKICLNGATCTKGVYYPGSGATTLIGDASAAGYYSSAANGAYALTLLNSGARIDLGGGANDYLYSDGSAVRTPGGFMASQDVYTPGVRPFSGNSLTLLGRPVNGASAVGLIFDTEFSLTTSGAKIVSFRNAGAEQAWINKDGTVGANLFQPNLGNSSATLKGTANDGGVGTVLDNWTALTSGKITSLRSNGVEKASVNSDGAFTAGPSGTGNVYAWNFGPASTGTAVLRGRTTDGGIATKIMNAVTPLTSGKIASFYSDDGTTERAYITWDGDIVAPEFNGTVKGPLSLTVDPTNCVTAGWASQGVSSTGAAQGCFDTSTITAGVPARATVDVINTTTVSFNGTPSGISGVAIQTPASPAVRVVRFTFSVAQPDTNYIVTAMREFWSGQSPSFWNRHPVVVTRQTTYFDVGFVDDYAPNWNHITDVVHRFSVVVHR